MAQETSRSRADDTPGLAGLAISRGANLRPADIMRPMPDGTTRGLHDRLLASLASSPRREVARSLPAGPRLDVDSFERHILGAERRLVRIGSAGGRPVA